MRKPTNSARKMAAPGTSTRAQAASTQSWKAMIGSALTTVATSTPYLAATTMAVLAGVVGASKYNAQPASTTVAATSVAAAALMAITYMVAGGGSMLIVGGISALAVAAVAVYEYKDSLLGGECSREDRTGLTQSRSDDLREKVPAAFPANSAADLEAGGTPAPGGAGGKGPTTDF
ncbi:hypothetical protein N9C31_01195 [Gammaproteobacteria bacterium]|nr:hypothetical protein [Gammaproteobacteria bacterium]